MRILNLGVDTAKPSGRLFLTLLAGFAKFERKIIRERCIAGLESARVNGVHLGRESFLTKRQRAHAQRLREEGKSISEVARILNTSRMAERRVMNPVQAAS